MALSRQTKISLYILSVTLFVSISVYVYQACFSPNLMVGRPAKMLYIPTGASFEQVMDSLEKGEFLSDVVSFRALARATGYMDKVKPGAYLIQADSPNIGVIRMLRNGSQTPMKLTFNNVRLPSDLAGKLAGKLEADSTSLLERLQNPDTCTKYGFTPQTITAMFIPNTYEVYWTISQPALWKRMKKEYDRFWTEERKAAAAAQNLSPIQVSTLASIVEAETKKADEMPIVAGVYLNRMHQNMPLQADPTVVYAVGDFSIKRVREGHKATDSPYNTYKVLGLPPGPINLPSQTALDAVLHPAQHDYIFFVARKDFSGYHTFAKDYTEHLKNARVYQKALDSLKL